MPKKFTQETYLSYVSLLNDIAKENPCQFDEQWKCIASRLWKILWDSCCTKSCWTVCSNLWATGCTTTNILCKTFFCPTAMEWLSSRAKFQIDYLQDIIGYLLWWGSDSKMKAFFYQDEKIIKKKLFPKK